MRPVDSLVVLVCKLACLAIATGCSQPEQPMTQQGFLVRTSRLMRSDSVGVRLDGGNCMEVLTANHEVLATVYRDSSDFLNDAARGQHSVILGASPDRPRYAEFNPCGLMEPWDPTLAHWKGGGYLDYVRSDAAAQRWQEARCWTLEGIRNGTTRPSCFRLSGLLHLSLRNPLEGYLGRRLARGSYIGIR